MRISTFAILAVGAVIAIIVILLTRYRHKRQSLTRVCYFCGTSLTNRRYYKDPVNGMPKCFCSQQCILDSRSGAEYKGEKNLEKTPIASE